MNIPTKDREILRELGRHYAEIANMDCQEATRNEWRRLNGLKENKPLVTIDQLPWHELNVNDELTLKCENPFCRGIEDYLRKTLYKWKHFPVDMVVRPYIPVGKVVHNSGFGVEIHENIQITDAANDVVSHDYIDSLSTEEDLARLHPAVVTYEEAATMERKAAAEEIFDGILPVRLTGVCPEFRVWDEISMFRGITPILYDFVDRPEFIHDMMEKFTTYQIDLLHQYERLGVLEEDLQAIHCTGAFTEELPDLNTPGPRTGKDCWAYGMAQLFSSCSKDMHEEFEIEYAKRYYQHVGLVYYGCCEPLHNKIDIIRQIPNVRKISTSPWADVDIAAANMAGDYVLSRKPNPAYLAGDSLDEAVIANEIRRTIEACRRNNTPCELILKDVSTVRSKPERLTRWAEIVNNVIREFY